MMLVAERKETCLTTQPSPPVPKAAASPCVAPALMTGAMLWACHYPLAWGWLGWVALVPFLTLARAEARPRRIYWAAYLAGLAFFVPVLQFMRVADTQMYATWLALAAYCAAYFPVGLWLIRMLDRRARLPMCVSVPLVWVALEWVRSFLMTGFAWYYLGHAQHRFSSLIQVADLGGVYAISFLVAAVNGWLCDLAFAIPALRDRFRWRETAIAHVNQMGRTTSYVWLQGVAVGTLLGAAVLYGMWRLEQDDFTPGPRVALLQTNIPQSTRNGLAVREQMVVQNFMLAYFACLNEPLVDLMVWPETSYMIELPNNAGHLGHYIDLDPKLPMEKVTQSDIEAAVAMRNHFRGALAVAYPTRHLLGINTVSLDASANETRYSSALLVEDDGTPTHRFDKIHRVPFGEYVPLRDWLPFMKVFAPYGAGVDYSISPGKAMTRFPLRNFTFGALVCFEDSDPYLARQYAQDGKDGKPVDFLVNMSNDGWFHDTYEHEEHLVVSLFRAIENRRALVRSVNMGISAVIDPNGRVLKPQVSKPEQPGLPHPSDDSKHARAMKTWDKMQLWPWIKELERVRPEEAITTWEVLPNRKGQVDELAPGEYAQYKRGPGVLLATVPIDRRTSVYSQWGDWLPMTCWGLCFATLGWTALRPRKTKLAAA